MKIFIKTMMAVIVALFFATVVHFYIHDTKARAEASIPSKPDFEHTNNQQLLDNVLQCVDYVYWKNKDFEQVIV